MLKNYSVPQKMNEASDAAVMGQVYSVKNEQEKDLTLLSLHLKCSTTSEIILGQPLMGKLC